MLLPLDTSAGENSAGNDSNMCQISPWLFFGKTFCQLLASSSSASRRSSRRHRNGTGDCPTAATVATENIVAACWE